MDSNAKEPLIHLTKRGAVPVRRAIAIRIFAVVIALIVCAIITGLTTGINPIEVYSSIVSGAFGSVRKTWITLQDVSILLIISLSLTIAFRMRFWNIGGEGQVLMGGLGAAACMICLGDKLPNAVVMILMLISSLVLGALWGFIPALCKAIWNTNETLSTLMMNYIATQLVLYFTILWEVPKGSGKIGIINQNSHAGWLPQLFGSKYLLPIILAIAVTAFVYVYIKYTKHGYEVRVVGESPKTSVYVGINVKKVIIRTMILSGALCGLVGLILVGGINHTLTATISDGRGFTAVLVSWMAQFNPFAMIATSFIIVFMDRGAGEIATRFDLNQSFGDILTGIILFFIIGCEFFINYEIHIRNHKNKSANKKSSRI
jgi:simple sugar transport system permease protein